MRVAGLHRRPRGGFLLGLNRAVRQQAGVEAGDAVEVEIAPDTTPREVALPDALAEALADDQAARAAFDALAYTPRTEYARWIEEAKREETRERRVAHTLERLREAPVELASERCPYSRPRCGRSKRSSRTCPKAMLSRTPAVRRGG